MTRQPDFRDALIDHARQEGRDIHGRVLAIVDGLADDQLNWRPGPHAPSIAFHVWHLARYADLDGYAIDGSPQIWEREGLAAAWGLPSSGLGDADTGMGMGDEQSESLRLPAKSALLEYTRAAFTVLDDGLDRLVTETREPIGNAIRTIKRSSASP